MTMITPSYLGETIEYSSLHACRSTLEDPTTLDEMVERLREERGVTVVRTAVWKLLDRHGQTHKKRPPMPASKSALM